MCLEMQTSHREAAFDFIKRSKSVADPLFFLVYSPNAGTLSDLHIFDLDTLTWTHPSVAASGLAPSARCFHGFTTAGGRLYVHAGLGEYGAKREEFHGNRLPGALGAKFATSK